MEQEKTNSLGELMRITMEHIKTMADANTIIGTPIHAEGVTLIPVSRMSFGMGGGGTEFTIKQYPNQNFGGGSAASAKLEPVAFLVVREDGSVKLLPVAPPPATTVDRVIETVPEVVDKVTGFIEKQQEKKLEKQEKAASVEDFAE
ncbi:MAG: sporulation protein YtfJ [Lawsonibacter sp.]|nr:sporulation protein YtfJ [Lawsonibacter sp.]